jgi:hypothetical protein
MKQTAAVAAATKKIILCEKFKFNNFLCITTLMSMVTRRCTLVWIGCPQQVDHHHQPWMHKKKKIASQKILA